MSVTGLLRLGAWACLAAIVVATLGNIGLRPSSGLSVHVERFGAFAVAGALFAAAYPRHLPLVAALVLGAVVVLELMQVFVASRHGRVFDAGVKLAGGGLGLVLGAVLSRMKRREGA